MRNLGAKPYNGRYKKLYALGRGGFGVVYAAKDLKTCEIVAIKQISNRKAKESLLRETDLLKQLHHPAIVKLLDSIRGKGNSASAVIEFAEGGSLESLIQKTGPLSEALASKYIRHVLDGLAFLHEKNIIHRDIKPANILLHNEIAKLADFGIAVDLFMDDMSQIANGGSIPFLPPEVFRNHKANEKGDIWAIGITTLNLLIGENPFHMKTFFQMLTFFNQNKEVPIPNAFSFECQSFLRKCLIYEPEQRSSSTQLLADPWITRAFDSLDLLDERLLIDAEENCRFLSTDAYFNCSAKRLSLLFQRNKFIEEQFLKRKSSAILVERLQKDEFQFNAAMLALSSTLSSSMIARELIKFGILEVLFDIFSKSGFHLRAVSIQIASSIGLQAISEYEVFMKEKKLNWLYEPLIENSDFVPFSISFLSKVTFSFPDDLLSSIFSFLTSSSPEKVLNELNFLFAECSASMPVFIKKLANHTHDNALAFAHQFALNHPELFIKKSTVLASFLNDFVSENTLTFAHMCILLKSFKAAILTRDAVIEIEANGIFNGFIHLTGNSNDGVSEHALLIIKQCSDIYPKILSNVAMRNFSAVIPF